MRRKVLVWVDGVSREVTPGDVIGRERAADIVVSHPDVSRRHAEIRNDGTRLELCDLGSTNGLWIDGSRTTSVALPEGRITLWLGPPKSAPAIDIEVTAEANSAPNSSSEPPTAPQNAHQRPNSLAGLGLPAEPPGGEPVQVQGISGGIKSPLGRSDQEQSPAPSNPNATTSDLANRPPMPGSPVSTGPVPPDSSSRPPMPGSPVSTGPVPPSPELNNAELAPNIGEFSQVFEAGASRVLLGRSRQCDLVLDDPLVSRRHAELVLTGPSEGRIVDLGSDNGTYVNGVRVRAKEISEGDLVELGRIQLILRQGKLEQHVAYGLPLRADSLSVVVDKDVTILNNVSFTLPAGSMTAIVGPSGSGKSTLLNALTARREADIGAVFLGGRNVYDAGGLVSQRIGFVPQDDPVHNNLTVEHALTAAAKMRLPQDTSKAEVQHNVQKVAHELGLSERLKTQVKALSGGQRKRVSVGYELVGEPQALILDEPTSGLDPGLERELMSNLRQLANRGTTTVVVTHSVQSVELCDQVLVLAPGGRLAFIGPPARAISHFGVEDLASVFSLLSSRPNAEWERHFAETSSFVRFVQSTPTPVVDVSAPKVRRSFFADFSTLLVRYVRLLLGDSRRLLFLVAQAPVLGILLALVLNTRAFDIETRSATREYLVAMILAMTLVGVLNSVREIVQDRPVFRREYAVGVSSAAFVLSRWVVLVAIVIVQAFVLFFLASIRQEAPIDGGVLLGSGRLELYLALAGVGVASVGIGLVVSAFVSDTPKALTMFPIVVIPAMLLSGLVVPTSGRAGIEQVTYLNPIQWGSSIASSTLNLPGSEGCDRAGSEQVNLPGGVVGEQEAEPVPASSLSPSCTNSRWSRTDTSQFINFFALFCSHLTLLVLAAWGARKTLSSPLRR